MFRECGVRDEDAGIALVWLACCIVALLAALFCQEQAMKVVHEIKGKMVADDTVVVSHFFKRGQDGSIDWWCEWKVGSEVRSAMMARFCNRSLYAVNGSADIPGVSAGDVDHSRIKTIP